MNEIFTLLESIKELNKEIDLAYNVSSDAQRKAVHERAKVNAQNHRTSPRLEHLCEEAKNLHTSALEKSKKKNQTEARIGKLVDELVERDEPVPADAVLIYTEWKSLKFE